jgi:protein-S-isoprenylcysteine O-methyltransferase Ste14
MESTSSGTPRRSSIGAFITSHRRFWEYLCNVVFAALSGLFMIVMFTDFISKHRTSSLLMCIFEGGMAWFALTRPLPKETNLSLYDWTIGLMGASLPLLLRPVGESHDHPLLLGAQLVGQFIYLAALFSLNKSFGMVAANRGIKTGGLYRVVRHPFYTGLILSNLAYVLQNVSATNAALFALFFTVTLMRIVEEERVLCRDGDYARYVQRTRWRILPLIY